MAPKAKIKNIPRDWWDFSDCPKDEISFCAAYEYFRQIALVHRKRFGKKWSSRAFEEVFNGYFKDGKRIEFKASDIESVADPLEINLWVKKMFALAACRSEGFPDVSYFSLNLEERRAWIKTLGLDKLRPDRPTMAQEDFFEICLQPKEAMMYYQFHCAEWVRQNLCKEGKDSDRDARWIVDYDGFPFELGVIRLNWSLSDKKLMEAFQKWLAKNRPEGVKVLETRGATQISESLKYLSALRLLAVMTAAKASDHTQASLGEPLYLDDDNWYAARDKARAVMIQLSHPFFTWG